MKTLLTTSIIFLLSYHSISQDRGCPGSDEYIKVETEDSIYFQKDGYGYYCWFLKQYENDTIHIQIEDDDSCEISWAAADNYHYRFYNSIRWYKDDIAIDPENYEFGVDTIFSMGDCYSYSGNNTSLKTNESGVYKFILGYNQYTTMYVKLEFLEDQDLDSIPPVLTSPTINFFPNPASNSLTINHGLIEQGEYTFYDLQGRLIQQEILNTDGNQTRISLNDFSNGSYLVQVKTDVHGILTEKLIIQK